MYSSAFFTTGSLLGLFMGLGLMCMCAVAAESENRLKRPHTVGWFWFLADSRTEPEIVLVTEDFSGKWIKRAGIQSWFSFAPRDPLCMDPIMPEGIYYGPISPPMEVVK